MIDRRSGAVLIASGVLFVIANCQETFDTTYRSLEEARQAGALQRGWLPSFVPPGATAIRERHDIDTNEIWGTFHFTEGDELSLRQTLVPVESQILEGRVITPGPVTWWPAALTGRLDGKALASSGFALFKDSNGYFAAVDWRERRCFFWRKRFS
jgi:hypothetical protein